jgi:hypothetical protein
MEGAEFLGSVFAPPLVTLGPFWGRSSIQPARAARPSRSVHLSRGPGHTALRGRRRGVLRGTAAIG